MESLIPKAVSSKASVVSFIVRRFMKAQTFSTGLKSGLKTGHGSFATPFSSSCAFTTLLRWMRKSSFSISKIYIYCKNSSLQTWTRPSLCRLNLHSSLKTIFRYSWVVQHLRSIAGCKLFVLMLMVCTISWRQFVVCSPFLGSSFLIVFVQTIFLLKLFKSVRICSAEDLLSLSQLFV